MESSEIEVYYDVEYLGSMLTATWMECAQGCRTLVDAKSFVKDLREEINPYKIRIVKRTYETVLTIE